jgi:hypothetical protein
MPKGTKVDDLYEELLAQGKTPQEAARIAQAKTGLSLKTGLPPKKKKSKAHKHPGIK